MPRTRNPIVIVHGWSDSSQSFQPMAKFLGAQGFQTVDLVLADYISMDDDVSIDDAANGMELAVQGLLRSGVLRAPFDLIVHSTGGLVARAWLSSYHSGKAAGQMPVQRMLMLAPANFGSALATVGQTIFGRVVRGWNHGLHTGKLMLQGLELGSPFQWELAMRDLFAQGPGDAVGPVYGPDLVWPFVMVGSMPYQSGIKQLANEHGSDGTVRVAATNMNAYGATLDFTATGTSTVLGMAPGSNAQATAQCAFVPWKYRYDESMAFPFAVMAHRDHSSIANPSIKGSNESDAEQQLYLQFLLQALACDSYAAYQAIEQAWRTQSDQVQDPASADDDHKMHFQINVFVVDEYQKPVTDYMVEFMAPNYDQNEDLTGLFHDKVICNVHKNEQNAALRTFYINRQRLFELFYANIPAGQPRQLRLSISAAAPGSNISYFKDSFGATGEFIIHGQDDAERWLHRNATHFLKIVIPRQPTEGVFKLKRFS